MPRNLKYSGDDFNLGIATANPKDDKLDLLTDKNSVLVLVDYQPSMFKSVSSGTKL